MIELFLSFPTLALTVSACVAGSVIFAMAFVIGTVCDWVVAIRS